MIDPRMLMPSQEAADPEKRRIARLIMAQRPTTPPQAGQTPDMKRIFEALSPADKMLVEDEMERGAPMWQTIHGSPPLPQDPAAPMGPGAPMMPREEPLDPMLEEDPRGKFYDIEGRNRFDDANAYQVADAGALQPSFAEKAKDQGLDLNVTQAQRAGQALRLLQAESILRDLESQGTRKVQRMLEWLPDGVENLVVDEDYGRFQQARDAFAEAAMRADTGATINESEWPRILKNLMPQPGDGDERIAQRRAAREVFIQSLMASSGDAQGIMPEIGQPVVPIEQQGGGATHRFNPATGKIEAVK